MTNARIGLWLFEYCLSFSNCFSVVHGFQNQLLTISSPITIIYSTHYHIQEPPKTGPNLLHVVPGLQPIQLQHLRVHHRTPGPRPTLPHRIWLRRRRRHPHVPRAPAPRRHRTPPHPHVLVREQRPCFQCRVTKVVGAMLC